MKSRTELPHLNVRALLCLALIHTLVDGYAQVISPLWPHLETELRLGPGLLTLLLAVWQLATSISQPVFGICGDRFRCRWIVAVGPALAIVCLSLIGQVHGVAAVAVLLAVGGMGIGAFHPEAAVAVTEVAGAQPGRALAFFVFGGLVGLSLGPLVSGILVQDHGLPALAWLIAPGLVLLGVFLVVGRASASGLVRASEPVDWATMLRGRWLAAGLLLTVATLRVVPALGIPLALAFVLNKQGVGEAGIGRVQSLYLFSGSAGALLGPWLVRPGHEVRALFWATLPAAGFLPLIISGQTWAYYPGLIGCGFLLQGTIPLLIAYSQRLLPQGKRLAASLTLGTSWGLGGLIVAGLQAGFDGIGWVEGMLWALVPFSVLAALSSLLLPASEPERPLTTHLPEPAAAGAS